MHSEDINSKSVEDKQLPCKFVSKNAHKHKRIRTKGSTNNFIDLLEKITIRGV